jgi:hypothetical protein
VSWGARRGLPRPSDVPKFLRSLWQQPYDNLCFVPALKVLLATLHDWAPRQLDGATAGLKRVAVAARTLMKGPRDPGLSF